MSSKSNDELPWYKKNGPNIQYIRNNILNKYKGNIITNNEECEKMKEIITENIPEDTTFSSFKEYTAFYNNNNDKRIQTILKEYNHYLCDTHGAVKNYISEKLNGADDGIIKLNNFDCWSESTQMNSKKK
tara:strand:+ start:70 stop:459 length:390 start_codon:yes stop_codon:yes gene_type:complete